MERKKKGHRKKSTKSQKVVSIKSYRKNEADPDATKRLRVEEQLLADYQQTLNEIEELEEKEARILATVPRVARDEQGKRTSGSINIAGYDPETGWGQPKWYLPDEALTDQEKLAIRALANLRGQEIGRKKRDLNFMRTKAAVEEIELPEEPGTSARNKGKPGPRGPRPQTIKRRAFVMLLKSEGVTGREACRRLNEMPIPLPSKKLSEIYHDDWVEYFDFDPQAFYKQWSADLKRG